MPPRRAPSTASRADTHEDRRENAPPPPNGDAATRALEGMTRFFEQQAPRPQHDVYEQFRRLGLKEPFVAEGWIRSLEVHFRYLNMGDVDRVRCATYMLQGDASLWWEGAEQGVDLATLTWEQFKNIFYEKYFTADVRGRLKREFMSLRQGDMSVADFIRKFDRGCHFVPFVARDAAEKLRHFMDGLRPTTRRDVMLMRPTDYAAATTCAFQAEQALKDIDFEMPRKRHQHQHQHQQNSQPNKRQFTGKHSFFGTLIKNIHPFMEVSSRIIRVQFAKRFKRPSPTPSVRPSRETVHKLYVSNLAWKVRSNSLREFISTSCNPVSVRVVFDNPSGKSAGYGFVSFSTKDEAESAISVLDGKELLGRPIRLKFSEKNANASESTEASSEELEKFSSEASS